MVYLEIKLNPIQGLRCQNETACLQRYEILHDESMTSYGEKCSVELQEYSYADKAFFEKKIFFCYDQKVKVDTDMYCSLYYSTVEKCEK